MALIRTNLTGTHTARAMFSEGWSAIRYVDTKDPEIKKVFYGHGKTEEEAIRMLNIKFKDQHAA
jgi:hypothetical protein